MGIEVLLVEVDAANVIQLVRQGQTEKNVFLPLIEDCKALMSQIRSCTLQHIFE